MADTTDIEQGSPVLVVPVRSCWTESAAPITWSSIPLKVRYGCGGFGVITVLALLITILASIVELGQNEQLLVKDPAGYHVMNGPYRGIFITLYPKETRKATLLKPEQYAVVKSELSGELRDVDGPHLLFLGSYDNLLKVHDKVVLPKDEYAVVKNELTGDPRVEEGPMLLHAGIYDKVEKVVAKVVLQKDEYTRLIDEVTGAERVIRGPQTLVPGPLERAANSTEHALYLNTDLAALVLNRSTGRERLVVDEGTFAPGPYESILEVRPLNHVLPHEAIVVRDSQGQLTVHMGTDGTDAAGMSFFLPPYSEILKMRWSDHSHTNNQTHKIDVEKIDMRARHIFFKYEVRTSDNVKLVLEGTIFWQVNNVQKMISATADPEGDVWHHARSALIEAVSNATLADFMSGFNGIVMDSFRRQAQDGFYTSRGVELQSMELTRFDCADAQTAQILQEIIEETTNRINKLTAQQSENDVKAAKLTADIQFEQQRTALIRTQSDNEKLRSEMQGKAAGLELARGASTFIDGLSDSVPNAESRVQLYKMHEQLKSRNADTSNLASGTAHLFLTPQDLNLRLDTRGSNSATSSAPEL